MHVYAYYATFRYRFLARRRFVHTRSDKTRGAGPIATARPLCRARVGDFHFCLDRRRQGSTVEPAERAERVALVRLQIFWIPMLQRRQDCAGAAGDAGYLFL